MGVRMIIVEAGTHAVEHGYWDRNALALERVRLHVVAADAVEAATIESASATATTGSAIRRSPRMGGWLKPVDISRARPFMNPPRLAVQDSHALQAAVHGANECGSCAHHVAARVRVS